MGSWHVRASAASITGACVFAVVTGAGAVFVGDWWGSTHHSTVVTQFVTAAASPAHSRPPTAARPVSPAVAGPHRGGATRNQAQADARTVRKAGSVPGAPAPAATKAGGGPDGPGLASGPASGPGNGQGGNGAQGQGDGPGNGQGPGGPDPTSAPATPPAGASGPAPSATPTAGTANGDQG